MYWRGGDVKGEASEAVEDVVNVDVRGANVWWTGGIEALKGASESDEDSMSCTGLWVEGVRM